MLAVRRSLSTGARLAALPRACLGGPVARLLCTTKRWDPTSQVHGAPELEIKSDLSVEEEEGAGGTKKAKPGFLPGEGGTGRARSSYFGAGGAGHSSAARFGGAMNPSGLSAADKSDLVLFQVYVRQRLGELQARLPPKMGTRERAELAFLEEQVVRDHMPLRRIRIRDPLRDVQEREIRHTNLPLLSRFVSEAGAQLPKRLTGVSPKKQRKLDKAIRRAQNLALMPKTWKLPRYRHASYADQFSMPERPPSTSRSDDDEFRDPPDIRFPNQWESTRNPLDLDLSRLVRAAAGTAPRPAAKAPGAGSPDAPTWPQKK